MGVPLKEQGTGWAEVSITNILLGKCITRIGPRTCSLHHHVHGAGFLCGGIQRGICFLPPWVADRAHTLLYGLTDSHWIIRNVNLPCSLQADKNLLRQELPNLRPECIRVLELTTALLKRCAEAGMTLYEIGNVMSRPFVDADEDPSELEKLCSEAKRAFEVGGGGWGAFVVWILVLFAGFRGMSWGASLLA